MHYLNQCPLCLVGCSHFQNSTGLHIYEFHIQWIRGQFNTNIFPNLLMECSLGPKNNSIDLILDIESDLALWLGCLSLCVWINYLKMPKLCEDNLIINREELIGVWGLPNQDPCLDWAFDVLLRDDWEVNCIGWVLRMDNHGFILK